MGAALNLFGLRKDGTEFPVDIMLKPIQTEAGTAVVSFVRDATEQTSGAGGSAPERSPSALHRREHRRIRDLSARSRRPHPHLEPRRRTHQGLQGGRSAGPALLALLYPGRDRARPPRRALAPGRGEGPRGRRGVARAQRRLPLLGQCRALGDPRQLGRGNELRQDHARRDRSQAGAGVDDRRAEHRAAGECGYSQAAQRVFCQHASNGSPRRCHAGALRRIDGQVARPVPRRG